MEDSLKAAVALARAVRDGMAGRADDVEILVTASDQTSYSVENDEVIPVLACGTWSVAMRALKGSAMATAATTSHDPADSIAALDRALSAAQTDALTDFAVTTGGLTDTRNLDPKVWALVDQPGDVRRMAVALRDGAREARPGPGLVLEAEVSVGRSVRALVTGRGVPVASASTAFSAFLMADGDHFDSWAGTSLPEASVVPSLGRDLVASLPKRELTCEGFFGGSGAVTAVLHPRLLELLLRALFLERVAGDRVLSGLSSVKEGDLLTDPRIELFDDPGAAGSLKGEACDDEGVFGARNAVISSGIVRSILTDRRTAKLLGARATGNGYRIPIMAEDRAEAPIRVGFGHLEMSPGEVPREALVKGKSVLITDLLGLHSSNKATGAFNNPVMGGLCLEDGVPVARAQAGQWSATGNVHTLLRELSGLSRERFSTGTALLPWVAAELRVA